REVVNILDVHKLRGIGVERVIGEDLHFHLPVLANDKSLGHASFPLLQPYRAIPPLIIDTRPAALRMRASSPIPHPQPLSQRPKVASGRGERPRRPPVAGGQR